MTNAATLVAAVISLCTSAGNCETHQLRVERRVCGFATHAEVPLNGQWTPGRARVTCTK